MGTEAGAGQSARPSELRAREHPRVARRLLAWVTALAFALPIAAYFWFIHQYAVNVIWGDQWADVKVIDKWRSGALTLGTLWMQHREERLFFPNILVIVLAETTHFNVVVEMYLSAILLVGAIGVLIVTHKRRSLSTPWVLYVPVAVMMLSFVQFANTLWGFQVAWYIVLCALSVTIFLLDRARLSGLLLTGAIVAAVVGSFSLLQGLLIWPAGLLLLYQRRREGRVVLTWLVAGVVTTGLYLFGFQLNTPGSSNGSYALHHPLVALRFFFLAIGDIVGVTFPENNTAVLVLGVGIFVIAAWLAITIGLRREQGGPRPIGVALICFGLLFALSTAIGRSYFGLWAAGSAEYPTFDLLTLVGCYLLLIARAPAQSNFGGQGSESPPAAVDAVVPTTVAEWKPWAPPTGRSLLVVRAVVIGVICLQVVAGLTHGLAGGRATRVERRGASVFLVNVNQATDAEVFANLVYSPSPFVRRMATVLRDDHLSLFASPAIPAPARTTVAGVFTSSRPAYPQDMTFVDRHKPSCVTLDPGMSVEVNLGSSPGSLHMTGNVYVPPTVEALFDPQSVAYTEIPFTEGWLNLPASHDRAVDLEITLGEVVVCQSHATTRTVS